MCKRLISVKCSCSGVSLANEELHTSFKIVSKENCLQKDSPLADLWHILKQFVELSHYEHKVTQGFALFFK